MHGDHDDPPIDELEVFWTRTYRGALSATVAAKANYLALIGEPSATPAAIERAKSRWQQLDARKPAIGVQMGELEDLESTHAA
jgi:hypothetical protein